MTVSGPNAQALTPVLQGAKAAVFGAVDYVSYASVEKGESVKVIFPAGGTAIAPRPMMILKTARQPDEARKFVDYVLSEEGQRAVADAWLMPARQDVAAKRPLFRTWRCCPRPRARPARRAPRSSPASPASLANRGCAPEALRASPGAATARQSRLRAARLRGIVGCRNSVLPCMLCGWGTRAITTEQS